MLRCWINSNDSHFSESTPRNCCSKIFRLDTQHSHTYSILYITFLPKKNQDTSWLNWKSNNLKFVLQKNTLTYWKGNQTTQQLMADLIYHLSHSGPIMGIKLHFFGVRLLVIKIMMKLMFFCVLLERSLWTCPHDKGIFKKLFLCVLPSPATH